MNRQAALLRATLAIVLILTAGCTTMEYKAAEDEYLIGWVLPNIDDSQPEDLDYPESELANYTYIYNYPAAKPLENIKVADLFQPTPNHAGWMSIGVYADLATPLNRTYHVWGSKLNTSKYRDPWLFNTQTLINYKKAEAAIQDVTDILTDESYYTITSPFQALPVQPGSETITIGTAPYTPASITSKYGAISLDGKLIRGNNGKAWIRRRARMCDTCPREFPDPTYQILQNEQNITQKSLANQFGEWDETQLYYEMQETGTYHVTVVIPLYYEVWHDILVDAWINHPGTDEKPPTLKNLHAEPRIDPGKPYLISAEIEDDADVASASIEYRPHGEQVTGEWATLQEELSEGKYSATIAETTALESLDLRITATDSSGNRQMYTIIPVALQSQEFQLNASSDQVIAGRGLRVTFKGECAPKECHGAALKYYVNGNFVKADLADWPDIIEDEDTKPEFKYSYETPPGFSDKLLNFTVLYPGTGIYKPTQASILLPTIISENDLAVRIAADARPKAGDSTQANITITNTGSKQSPQSTLAIYVDGKEAQSRQVRPLNPQESEPVAFSWVPSKKMHNFTAAVNYQGDEFQENNRRELNIRPVAPDLYVSGPSYVHMGDIYTNDELNISFGSENVGEAEAYNVTNALILLQDLRWLIIPLERVYKLKMDGKSYEIRMASRQEALEVNITEGSSTVNAVMTPYIPYMHAFGNLLYVQELNAGLLPREDARVFFGKYQIIAVNHTVLDIRENTDDDALWGPQRSGDFGLFVSGNSSRELNFRDNTRGVYLVTVLQRAPDLAVNLTLPEEAKVNRTVEIVVGVENKRPVPSVKPIIELFDVLPSGRRSLIDGLELPEIGGGASIQLRFNWTPQAAGTHTIELSAFDDDDAIPWNNYQSKYVPVVTDGPQIILEKDGNVKEKTKKGETLQLRPKVKNRGGGSASVNVSLYQAKAEKLRDFYDFERNHNSKQLVSVADLGVVAPGEEKTAAFEYAVQSNGGLILYAEANATGDSELMGHVHAYWLWSLREGVDMQAEFDEAPAYAAYNRSAFVSARVSSFGTQTPEAVNASIWAGGRVIASKAIDPEFGGYMWTDWIPDSMGNITLKVSVSASQDVYQSNDGEDVIVPVVGSRKMRLRSSAPEGGKTFAVIEGSNADVPPEGAEFNVPDAPAFVWIVNSWSSGQGGGGGGGSAESGEHSAAGVEPKGRFMSFSTEKSVLGAEESVQSDLKIGQGRVGWLMVYATAVSKVSWPHQSARIYFYFDRRESNATWQDLASAELYACENWEGACISEWKLGKLDSLWQSAVVVTVVSSHTKARAFMLAIKDYDLDGKPDYRDEDDDGDGKNDDVDSVKCRGLEQGFDSDVREPAASPTALAEPNSRLSRNGKPLAEFATDLNDRIDCSEIKVKLQDEASPVGYIIISGLNISQPKAVFVEKKSGAGKVCIKDAEVGSISEVTPACSGADEYHLTCNGSYNSGYSCTDTSTSYKITGLRHSAVVEDAACVESWNCTEWGACISGQQTRTCTDANSCGTARGKPAEGQSCGSAGGDGGGGGTYTSNPDTPSITSRYDIQLERQSTLQLYKGDRASFSFKGNDYSLAAGFILPKQMSLIKSGGKRAEVKIGIGSSAEIDVDDDGWTDISAAYTGYSTGRATVVIGPKQARQPPVTTQPTMPRPITEPEQDYTGAPTPPDATAPYTPPYQLPTEDFPEDEPDEPSTIMWIEDYRNYLIIAVGAALLILLGIGVYVLLSRKTGHSGTSLLANSVRQNLRQGFTEQQVRSQMRKVGWSDRQIEKAFREARK